MKDLKSNSKPCTTIEHRCHPFEIAFQMCTVCQPLLCTINKHIRCDLTLFTNHPEISIPFVSYASFPNFRQRHAHILYRRGQGYSRRFRPCSRASSGGFMFPGAIIICLSAVMFNRRLPHCSHSMMLHKSGTIHKSYHDQHSQLRLRSRPRLFTYFVTAATALHTVSINKIILVPAESVQELLYLTTARRVRSAYDNIHFYTLAYSITPSEQICCLVFNFVCNITFSQTICWFIDIRTSQFFPTQAVEATAIQTASINKIIVVPAESVQKLLYRTRLRRVHSANDTIHFYTLAYSIPPIEQICCLLFNFIHNMTFSKTICCLLFNFIRNTTFSQTICCLFIIFVCNTTFSQTFCWFIDIRTSQFFPTQAVEATAIQTASINKIIVVPAESVQKLLYRTRLRRVHSANDTIHF